MQRKNGKDSFNSENDNKFWLKEIGEKNQNIYGLSGQVRNLLEKLNDSLKTEIELLEKLVVCQCEKTQCSQDKSLLESYIKTNESERLQFEENTQRKKDEDILDKNVKRFWLKEIREKTSKINSLSVMVQDLQDKLNHSLKRRIELQETLAVSQCEKNQCAQDKSLLENYIKTKENNCKRLQEELVDPLALHSEKLTGLEDMGKEVTLSMQEDFNKRLEEECKKNKSELDKQVKDLKEKLNDALQREMELQDKLVISQSEKTQCALDKSLMESSLKTKENECDRLQEELPVVDLPALISKALTELEDVFKGSKLEKWAKTFNHKGEQLENEHDMASEKVEELTDVVLNLKTYLNKFMVDLLKCTSVVTKPKKLDNSFVLDLKKRYIEGDKQTQMTKKTEGAYQFKIDHLKKKIEFHERIHQTQSKTNIHMKQQPEKTKPYVSVKKFVNIQSNNYQARRVHQSKKKLDAYDYKSVYRIQNRTDKFVEQKPEITKPFKLQPNSQQPTITMVITKKSKKEFKEANDYTHD